MGRAFCIFAAFVFITSSERWVASSFILPGEKYISRLHKAAPRSASLVPDPRLEGCGRTLTEPPCFWKPTSSNSRWERRIHLDDLKVGQPVKGTVVQELLDGKTGPKLFLEVGAGRTNSEGKWSIVYAMLRLSRTKESVVRKRAARLRAKESIDVWISRVQRDCGRLEVCLDVEEIGNDMTTKKRPVMSLKGGEEVLGRVVRVEKYGVLVDVGANRHGLLHILKVRSLYGKFVDGEKGLIEVGLQRGAKVRLCVESVDKRRLSLDFTRDVKEEAAVKMETIPEGGIDTPSIQNRETTPVVERSTPLQDPVATQDAGNTLVEIDDEDDDDYDDEDDDYDEDRDIEDSLGLGFY